MKVDIQIDSSCVEPEVTIRTASLTREVQQATEILAGMGTPSYLAGFRNGSAHLLEPVDVRRIYAAGGKVFAVTKDGEYTLRMPLYEAEQRLTGRGFIRISHSEILNLQEVKRFDLSLSGTILVELSDGSTSFVSRRYVKRIRMTLGM